MFRLVLRFFLLLIFFAVIRAVVTTVARLFTQTFRRPAGSPPPGHQPLNSEIGGELKQDPVCGTFVPTSASIKKTVNGETVHFCSVVCRDKFKVA
jgi:YHS domain-containing protein